MRRPPKLLRPSSEKIVQKNPWIFLNYQNKNLLFKRRLRSYVQPPFLLLHIRTAAFRLDSSREKTGCYVQISAATVYTAL